MDVDADIWAWVLSTSHTVNQATRCPATVIQKSLNCELSGQQLSMYMRRFKVLMLRQQSRPNVTQQARTKLLERATNILDHVLGNVYQRRPVVALRNVTNLARAVTYCRQSSKTS